MNRDRTLARCGIIAGPLFILVFHFEGVTRHGYDPARFPVSSLSIGHSGWVQVMNFVVTGTLVSCFAWGLKISSTSITRSRWTSRLIGLAGIGLIGAGLFVSDPIYGYPDTLPYRVAQFTWHGHLHDLFSMFFFAGLASATFVSARNAKHAGDVNWARFSCLVGTAMIVLFVLTSWGFKGESELNPLAGGLQRATIIAGMIWLSALGVRQRKAVGVITPWRS